MSVVLITGSCGLVGSESSKFFCEKGFDVVGIDNNYRKFFYGTDGDTNWVKKDLINKHKNYANCLNKNSYKHCFIQSNFI